MTGGPEPRDLVDLKYVTSMAARLQGGRVISPALLPRWLSRLGSDG